MFIVTDINVLFLMHDVKLSRRLTLIKSSLGRYSFRTIWRRSHHSPDDEDRDGNFWPTDKAESPKRFY